MVLQRPVKSQARRRPRAERSAPAAGTWRRLTKSAAETDRLGRAIGRSVQGGEVVALYGELGSGKTALVRGLAAGLGAPPRAVSSPTFVLIHEYHGRVRLAHADLYRLDSATELPHIGLSDYEDGRTVIAIEWADKAGEELPGDRLDVHLRHQSPTAREIVLRPTGPQARRLLARVRTQSVADRRRRSHR
ncbi:MAG: tRNA (adenosine(37)-N6)-threonylcarbamoyltransferase complex ATPase subunit type 1 TsaE [Nitrospiraceae bacterium]